MFFPALEHWFVVSSGCRKDAPICRPGLHVALVLGAMLILWTIWNWFPPSFFMSLFFHLHFWALGMLPVARASCSYHRILILSISRWTLPTATFFSTDRFHTAGLPVLLVRQWTVSLCNHLRTEFRFLSHFKAAGSSNCQTGEIRSFTSFIYSWLFSLPPMFVLVTLLRRSSTQPHPRSSSVWRGGSK